MREMIGLIVFIVLFFVFMRTVEELENGGGLKDVIEEIWEGGSE